MPRRKKEEKKPNVEIHMSGTKYNKTIPDGAEQFVPKRLKEVVNWWEVLEDWKEKGTK
jgi:hypothetical protein